MTIPNTQQGSPYSDDEISLIDLTKILIRRWKVVVLTFLLVVLGALAYALLQERTYEYVSIYQVAEQAASEENSLGALETPKAVLAKMQNLYLGPAIREVRQAAELEGLPFGVSVSNPDDTLLVRVTSEASEANSELVKQLHERLLALIQEDQEALLERNRERLEQQLQGAQQALEAAEQGNVRGDLLAVQISRIAELETRLSQLNEGRVAQVAVQSFEPTGTGRTLILILGILLGGILAIMAAFLTHFSSLVSKSLKEEAR